MSKQKKIVREASLETCKNEFKIGSDNRAINLQHVRELKKQLKDNLDMIPPIVINSRTHNIVDGQHRLMAFIELMEDGELPEDSTLSFYTVDINETSKTERECIVEANTHSKNWTLDDYVKSYALGNGSNAESYKKLQNWCENHSLTHDEVCTREKGANAKKKICKYRYGAAIIKGVNCAYSLKNGSFELSDAELKNANIIHTEMVGIYDALDCNSEVHSPSIESMAISWNSARTHLNIEMNSWIDELHKDVYKKMPHNTQSDWNTLFDAVAGSLLRNK